MSEAMNGSYCFLLAKKMALNNQLQKYLRHFTLFWLFMIFSL